MFASTQLNIRDVVPNSNGVPSISGASRENVFRCTLSNRPYNRRACSLIFAAMNSERRGFGAFLGSTRARAQSFLYFRARFVLPSCCFLCGIGHGKVRLGYRGQASCPFSMREGPFHPFYDGVYILGEPLSFPILTGVRIRGMQGKSSWK